MHHVISGEIDGPTAPSLEEWFYNCGSLGIEKTDRPDGRVLLKSYFDAQKSLPQILESLMHYFPEIEDLQGFTMGVSKSSEPKKYDPFPLLENYWVVSPDDTDFLEKNPSAIPLFLRLGPAFGSGRHETTALVAQALFQFNPKPKTLLDLGTGSGILAVFAKKWGVEEVEAAEISPEARENAKENFRLNGMEIPLYENIHQTDKKYDVILANILTPTVIYLKDKMLSRLKPAGHLILSGITQIEENQVIRAFQDYSLLSTQHLGLWSGLVYENSPPIF